MRISAKGRYALASAIYMAQEHSGGAHISIISISEQLGISKIYLEQVFSLLKRGNLVTSIKGAQGGYLLSRAPREITAYDILSAVEVSMCEGTGKTVAEKAPHIESAMKALVFDMLDQAIKDALENTTLEYLIIESEKHKNENGHMFFI